MADEARTTLLRGELRARLDEHYPDWRAGALTVAGAGVNFLVFRAATVPFGPVAIRVPWVRTIVNDNDGELAARALLTQEAAVAAHVGRHGVPSPAVHALHLGEDGFDFLATAFVVSDGSAPDQFAFGRLVRALHDAPPPSDPLIEQGGLPAPQRIAGRLVARAAAFGRRSGAPLLLPSAGEMAAVLAPRADHRALLHMDARPANLFTHGGRIVAIADWGNALIGDPALEVARIAEMGHIDAAFEAGYGPAGRLGALAPAIETLYRLDAVVMLALVFVDEAPDPALAEIMAARARSLAARL